MAAVAGIGAISSLVSGLFKASAVRAAGAKDENAALNAMIPAFDQAVAQVVAQANSGQISPADAIAAMQAMGQQFWQAMSAHQNKPGQAMSVQCLPISVGPGTKPCAYTAAPCVGSKTCTAGCCIGCNVIDSIIDQAIYAFQNGGGTITGCVIIANKYGLQGRPQYVLNYSAPPAGSGELNHLLSYIYPGTAGSPASGAGASQNQNLIKFGLLGAAVLVLVFVVGKK